MSLPARSRQVLLALSIAAVASALAPGTPALAQEPARTAFRVCQDPANLAFSDAQGNGFENRIAQLLAGSLGLLVQYYDFPQRLGFIRDTLRFRLPGEAYACDVVMGVPARYDQTATTRPYYRSVYTLVLGPALEDVDSVSAFLSLPQARRTRLRIGVYDRSPASEWLARHGLLAQSQPYAMLNADPAHQPGAIIECDLARGDIDAALVWGPIAGYFVQRLPEAGLRMFPLASEPGLPLAFDIALGVRHGEGDWTRTLEALLLRHRAEIDAILVSFNVPLVPIDAGTPR